MGQQFTQEEYEQSKDTQEFQEQTQEFYQTQTEDRLEKSEPKEVSGHIVRSRDIEKDAAHHASSIETEEDARKALYDTCLSFSDDDYVYEDCFDSPEDAKKFMRTISRNDKETEAWKERPELVARYVENVRSYIASAVYDRGMKLTHEKKNEDYPDYYGFEMVGDGTSRRTGNFRRGTQGFIDEFQFTQKSLAQEVSKMIGVDNFLYSSANTSRIRSNRGNIVMVFAPVMRITRHRYKDGKREPYTIERPLYIKFCFNQHPARGGGRTYEKLQLISCHVNPQSVTTLFTNNFVQGYDPESE